MALGISATVETLRHRKPDEAIDVCRRLVEATPGDPGAHYLLGRTLRDLGNIRGSIGAFQHCLTLNPLHVGALHDLGTLLVKAGLGRLGAPFLETAVKIQPDHASAHVELGNLLLTFGETERAFACFHRAYELRPLATWAAEKSPADFSVLLIASPGVANTPPDFLFGNADFDRHFFSLLPDVAPDIDLLRAHADIVVNLISDVDQGRSILSMAADLVDRLGKPIVNHPRKILATSREGIANLLSGIPRCRVPHAIRCSRDMLAAPEAAAELYRHALAFPLLLRVAGTHGGDAFEKICKPDDVAAFLVQHPGGEFYATEYADYRSRDGYFRKYRFIFTNGEILPYHLAIADQWKVHHFKTDMIHHAWMQDEEKAFLDEPARVFSAPQFSALREIQAAVGLEFFGIDCSVDRDGSIVVFEVNASMLVHDDNADFPYKTPCCVRIKEAFSTMLARAHERSLDDRFHKTDL